MKKRLLDIIICPVCKNKLILNIFSQREDHIFLKNKERLYTYFKNERINFNNWVDLYKYEIISGILYCKCGCSYPIIDGIPRLLQSAKDEYNDFYIKNKELIKDKSSRYNVKFKKSYHELSKKSFEMQWNKYNYKQTTWLRSQEIRRKEFLENFRISDKDIKGKLIFDAGCGNGVLPAGVANFGCEVVALDFTRSVENADKNKVRFAGKFTPFVHFIQGDLSKIPIKEEVFDLIHSSGVIHHTPEPDYTFKQFVKTAKKNAKVYILMYKKRKDFFGKLNYVERFITTKLSKKILFKICLFLAPLHKQISGIVRRINGEPSAPKISNKELAIIMFDNWSPKYQYRYTLQELIKMYKNENVLFQEDVSHKSEDKHCIGILGVKN